MPSDKDCCVPGCKESENSHPVLHGFPNPATDRERFDTWLYTIACRNLLWLKNEHIYKYRRVCRSHFEKKYLCRNKRLSKIAVPTLNMPGENGLILHNFPNPNTDQNQFDIWFHAIGGDILALDNLKIFKERRVCHSHFG